MAEERLDLRKEIFNKTQYIKTINTSFDELGNTTITEDLQVQPTVEEFFGLYNSLAMMKKATKEVQEANSQLVNTSTTLSENTNTSTGGGNSTGASSNY